MVEIKPGVRVKSAICATEMMIVKATSENLDIRCGGEPVIEMTAEGNSGTDIPSDFTGGTQVGKRYVNEEESIEILCTKAGDGALSQGKVVLGIKESKALPSSD
tara:strand:- start:489 stop:800 length:312 start_codon:yes stop_codon:yes gene_type:complete